MRRHSIWIVPVTLAGSAMVIAMQGEPGGDRSFTSEFGFDQTTVFLPNGANAYMSLQPGSYKRFAGEEDGAAVELEITVLPRVRPVVFEEQGRKMIAFTRIVEEREYIDGELAEVSKNYYAMCSRTGNIYNFGEDAEKYEDGRIVSRDGSWLAGKDGARPGMLMPQTFLLGARYSQAIAPGVSMDRAEHIEMGLTVVTPAGAFANCIKVLETTPLEPDEETISIFAPDIGLIEDDELILVEYNASR